MRRTCPIRPTDQRVGGSSPSERSSVSTAATKYVAISIGPPPVGCPRCLATGVRYLMNSDTSERSSVSTAATKYVAISIGPPPIGCPRCLATGVRYLMNSDTPERTSERAGSQAIAALLQPLERPVLCHAIEQGL